MAKVEEMVVQGLKEQAGVDATVSCGAPWVVGKVGQKFECEAKAGDDTRKVVVTVKDLSGDVGWVIE
jgi:hypothetical protein